MKSSLLGVGTPQGSQGWRTQSSKGLHTRCFLKGKFGAHADEDKEVYEVEEVDKDTDKSKDNEETKGELLPAKAFILIRIDRK